MSAVLAKLFPEVNNVENIITIMTGIQSNDNKSEVVQKIAEMARKNKDVLEKKAPDLEPFLIECGNLPYAVPMLVAGIRAIYDNSVLKNHEAGTDRAIEVLKHYLDNGILKPDQLKHCLDIFVPLVRNAAYYCSERKKEPGIGYDIAEKAMTLIFDQENFIVSSLHSAFLFLCIELNKLQAALPYIYSHVSGLVNENPYLIESPFDLTVRKPRNATTQYFDSKFLLQYLYYSAVVLLSLNQYRRAIIFLEHSITLPISNPTPVQINAFKKFYIVSLILHGRLDIPSSRSSALLRAWKSARTAPYTQLALAADAEDNICEVQKTLQDNSTIFREDENFSLVETLIETLKYKAVLKVAKSFSSITLENLTTRSKLNDEALVISIIEKLVESGELNAEINKDSKIINLCIPVEYIKRKDIDDRIKKLEYMCGEVKRMDLAARLNPVLITRNIKTSNLSYFQDDEGLSMSNNPIDM